MTNPQESAEPDPDSTTSQPSSSADSSASPEDSSAKAGEGNPSTQSSGEREDASGQVRKAHTVPSVIGTPSRSTLPIVGIGASAGGLQALKTFFAHVPGDSGLAWVVVMHLSPEHKSHLAELLQPHVSMHVQQVTSTIPLQPNNVYVIPPGANLDTIDTHLRLSELEKRRQERAPIDHFLRTLSATHDRHAIGVILTGTGSDGTLGLRQIKERGGLTIVQDPNEAEYDGMPQSAITTGLVDLILPLARIPEAILGFTRTQPRVIVPMEGDEIHRDALPLLSKVFAQLRTRTGRDFTHYKHSTILRRITRRMQFNHIEELSDYLELLRSSAEEVRTLADDLLITVTNFFRDPAVFEVLEQKIVPQLFESKQPGDTLRIWSVGCATGEEAYSLTILLLEAAARVGFPISLQVFASDLHERSLRRAREGFYPGDIETDVSPERLERYFEKIDSGYRIRKEVRELVVFAPHNLLGDPPFSQLDLISCRNVLIYLQRELQRDVIDLFHYALKPAGYLLLGTSETIETNELFRLLEKKGCVYQKRNVPAPEPRLPVFPLTQRQYSGTYAGGEYPREPVAYGKVHQRMAEQFAPPSVLVSPDDKVVHISEHAGRFMQVPGGEPTVSIFKLVREELAIELRTTLHAARETRQPVSSRPLPVQFSGESVPVVVHVRPAVEPQQQGFVLVIFDERSTGSAQTAAVVPTAETATSHSERETELELMRQRLQSIIEDYETGQEELRATNEELQSANEELRSTLEELETSKEELQSMNEELQTVNQENRHKVEELAQLAGDLQNLLAATDIATLFLDRQLRILRFTPRVTELFSVRMTDRGRPLSDLTHRLGYDELADDAGRVLQRLIPIEREVQDVTERWYLTRVLPYRSSEDRIEGVVITFVEITERKRAEESVRKSEERVRLALDAAEMGSFVWYPEQQRTESDARVLTLFGLPASGTLDSPDALKHLIHPDDQSRYAAAVRRGTDPSGQGELSEEIRVLHPDGTERWLAISARTTFGGTPPRPLRTAGVVADVSKRRQSEQQLRAHEQRFRGLVEQVRDYAIFMTDTDGRPTTWNAGVRRVLGLEEPEFIGRDIIPLIFTPEDIAENVPETELQEAAATGSARSGRWMQRMNGDQFWSAGIVTALRDDDGNLAGFMKVMQDQTEQKRLHEELQQAADELALASRRKDEFLATLAHELRNPLAPIRTGLELMKLSADDPETVEEARHTMERQTDQLIMLVDDLLDVSRITRGKLNLKPCRVNLSEVIRNGVEASQPLIDEARHQLTVEVPQRPIHLHADPHRLAQVVSNLLNNAARYTPPGGQVRLSAIRDNGEAVITVEDNGIGISPDMLERIFEMFGQSDRTATVSSGLGIGLTLVKSLVELHGGSVVPSSDGTDKGSRFTIRLPIVDTPETDSASTQQSADHSSGNQPGSPTARNLRVLIVDDNEAAARMLSRVVSAIGNDVRTAGDGQQAVDIAAEYRPHVVVMDIGMPQMSGIEAARIIRQQPWGHSLVLIALTGWGQEEDRRETRQAGFDHHLVKPPEPAVLQKLLATVRPEQ